MPWFHYRQNNSGGLFGEPAINVLIEAQSARIADAIADDNGLYFDGCSQGLDCSCCGDRWSNAYGKGDEVPSIYGECVNCDTQTVPRPEFGSLYEREKVPYALLIFADGQRRELRIEPSIDHDPSPVE